MKIENDHSGLVKTDLSSIDFAALCNCVSYTVRYTGPDKILSLTGQTEEEIDSFYRKIDELYCKDLHPWEYSWFPNTMEGRESRRKQMEQNPSTVTSYTLFFSKKEVGIIAGCIKAARQGLDDREFPTRIGMSTDEADAMRHDLAAASGSAD